MHLSDVTPEHVDTIVTIDLQFGTFTGKVAWVEDIAYNTGNYSGVHTNTEHTVKFYGDRVFKDVEIGKVE